MFGFGGSVKIYYCPTPVNMRKSFDGLAGAVEEYIKQDPESGKAGEVAAMGGRRFCDLDETT